MERRGARMHRADPRAVPRVLGLLSASPRETTRFRALVASLALGNFPEALTHALTHARTHSVVINVLDLELPARA